MSKLDEVKEILNTLRIAMSISFGMLVIAVAGVIGRFDKNLIDYFFWFGVVFIISLLIVIFKLIMKISEKTKEIREL